MCGRCALIPRPNNRPCLESYQSSTGTHFKEKIIRETLRRTRHALLHHVVWQCGVRQPLLPAPELLCLHEVVHQAPVLGIKPRTVGGLSLADLLQDTPWVGTVDATFTTSSRTTWDGSGVRPRIPRQSW